MKRNIRKLENQEEKENAGAGGGRGIREYKMKKYIEKQEGE